MPSGSATSTLTTIATSTWLNVSMARSHSGVRPSCPPGIETIVPMAMKHSEHPSDNRQPLLRNATQATNTTTRSQGIRTSDARNGSRTSATRTSLTVWVPPMIGTPLRRRRCAQSTASFTPPLMSTVSADGKVDRSSRIATAVIVTTQPITKSEPLRRLTDGRRMSGGRDETDRSAVVIRSSATASSTMARPGTNAAPTSPFCRPLSTRLPRSSAPRSDAITTMANAIMITWLRPSRIVLRAIGSCTFRSC